MTLAWCAVSPVMSWASRCALIVAIGLSNTTGPGAQAQEASRFDGNWIVVTKCPAAVDGAKAYTLRYAAVVRGGVFHGENGAKGQPGYLTLDGTIAPDGSAILVGRGLTGASAYTLNHPAEGQTFSYRVQSQFRGDGGTGKRVENRPCENTYSRQ